MWDVVVRAARELRVVGHHDDRGAHLVDLLEQSMTWRAISESTLPVGSSAEQEARVAGERA
jgi:hypothetical protein